MVPTSTMQPFSEGDVLVGATVLDDPNDDHAGKGRIIQYDSELLEKGTLWVDGTTRLILGLKFHPSGELWAFEGGQIIIVGKDGRPRKSLHPSERRVSNVNFASDGSFYLGEHLVGDKVPVSLGTSLAMLPNQNKLGDGYIYKYDSGGKLLKTFESDTHGGMAGFLGVTHSVLTFDEKRIIYTSETGNRIMQYDVENDKQLPDLATYNEGRTGMVFGLAYTPGGELLVLRGDRLFIIDDGTGQALRKYQLDGFGWATITTSFDKKHVYLGNFLTGQLAKLDLFNGEIVASANVGVERSLAGVAEFPAMRKQ